MTDDDDDHRGRRPGLAVEQIIVNVPIFQQAELEELEAAANAHVASGIRLRSIARRLIRKAQAARARWGTGDAAAGKTERESGGLTVVTDRSVAELRSRPPTKKRER